MKLIVWGVLLCAACGSVDKKRVPDASEADACVPETDQAFCARATDACETRTAPDNCGAMRTADCGACTGGKGCVVGTCKTPVCSGFTYTTSTLAAFSRTSIEDSILSATASGRTVMFSWSPTSCGAFATYIADEVAPGSGTYTNYNVAATFTTLGLLNGQDTLTLSSDGLTVIARSSDSKKLLVTKRSALDMTDFGTPSDTETAAINATVATAGNLTAPVLSDDGLELFYAVYNATAQVNGIYSAVRSSTSEPFPAGTKLGPPVSDYPIVTGVSSDRLALFVFYSFQTRILTRSSTNAAWVNSNAPADPPTISNWSVKPLADCARLIAMASPGGCAAEDIVVMQRQ